MCIIDPEFLAALPEHLRNEILDEQNELQRVIRDAQRRTEVSTASSTAQNPTVATSSASSANTGVNNILGDIAPEVFADLPPQIQDEVRIGLF